MAAIAAHIHQQSPQNAILVRDRINAEIGGLRQLPDRFRVHLTSRRRVAVHAMVVDPFIVYYKVDDAAGVVTVLRILHGARRQPRRF